VWHCHILEQEDNEMMRPYVVVDDGKRGLQEIKRQKNPRAAV
jgi:hypothetical protein